MFLHNDKVKVTIKFCNANKGILVINDMQNNNVPYEKQLDIKLINNFYNNGKSLILIKNDILSIKSRTILCYKHKNTHNYILNIDCNTNVLFKLNLECMNWNNTEKTNIITLNINNNTKYIIGKIFFDNVACNNVDTLNLYCNKINSSHIYNIINKCSEENKKSNEMTIISNVPMSLCTQIKPYFNYDNNSVQYTIGHGHNMIKYTNDTRFYLEIADFNEIIRDISPYDLLNSLGKYLNKLKQFLKSIDNCNTKNAKGELLKETKETLLNIQEVIETCINNLKNENYYSNINVIMGTLRI